MKALKEKAAPAVDIQEAEAALNRLKNRIINVIPPGTVYLETLLKLSAVKWSEEISTAAITCSASPNLLFNRAFVEKYCLMDEDIMILVLHELHHVLYGHHTLFPGTGMAHNIAFDAVINARLCNVWKTPRHARFFRRFYKDPEFPEILLCPPPGWPDDPLPEDRDKERARLMQKLDPRMADRVLALRDRLYAPDGGVTYEDVLSLLRDNIPESEPRLLGSHGGEVAGLEGQAPASDPFLVETARSMDQGLKKEESGRGAGSGIGLHDIQPNPKNPRAEFLRALRAVLVKAGIYRHRQTRRRRREMVDSVRQSITVLPDFRDRTAMARETLLGIPPMLYAHTVPARAASWEPAGTAHVYLDVSGSMFEDLPWIVSALAPLETAGLCRIYLFSTVVANVPKGGVGGGKLKTTYGTDIDCILQHMLDLPSKKRPRKAVALTDGYFSIPPKKTRDLFAASGIELHGAVTHNGGTTTLEKMTSFVTKLPAYK